jgi:predicted nucleic acid-binding protein
MSWVNLGEVAYIVHRRFGREESHSVVQDLRAAVNVLLPDEPLILQAAEIKATYAMAYADAFAAATTVQCAGELLTGDPELLIPGSPWQWIDLRQ